jgi:hypothetical protein
MEPAISRRESGKRLARVAAGTALLALQPACSSQLSLPAERPHLGPMKSVASARTSRSVLPSGQLLMTIEHDVIRGVSPQMLRWWLENMSQTMVYRGTTYPRYLLWHPRDHIRLEVATRAPSGGTGQGAYWRIVEAFAANPDFYVDATVYVEKLDEEGISLVRRERGIEFFRLEHRYAEVRGGASYRSRMVVGPASGLVRGIFNELVRPRLFPDEMGAAWLTHNVEEVSMLEHILPSLHAGRS